MATPISGSDYRYTQNYWILRTDYEISCGRSLPVLGSINLNIDAFHARKVCKRRSSVVSLGIRFRVTT